MDCGTEPRAVGWGCNQVSLLETEQNVGRTFADAHIKSLAKNHEKGVSGGVTPDTYVAFVIIECIA